MKSTKRFRPLAISSLLLLYALFTLGGRAESPVIVTVTPEIHELSDLKGKTSVDFLHFLKEKEVDEYVFWKALRDGYRKKTSLACFLW
jgi:hypothetical protein